MVKETEMILEERLDEGIVEELAKQMRGALIQPGDGDYDQVRQVYNGMIDKRPALIARCENVADVIAAVNTARRHNLDLAIRGGGHNGAGLGLCNGGLVIDLTAMKGIRVDPEARTARVGGGCTWGEVDHATHAFGLAVPSGFISTTGVGGLTLGGGIGYLSRKYGLTIDNLLEVDMVLADGSFVTASETQYPDLFWAVRGGGGNFGVATEFKFKLHPVNMVTAGPTLWPMEKARKVMQWYREFILSAPEDLNGFLALMTVPPAPPFPAALHKKKMCGIVWCYTGPEERADQVFEPVRKFGPPALFGVQQLPFPVLQSVFDALYPPGLQWYWRGDFFNQLSDQAIDQHLKHSAQLPSLHSTMHLYPIDGAVHRIGAKETAFSFREANWTEVIVGVDPDPRQAERLKQWTVDYWEALHPYSAGGSYVNFMMEEGQERVQATYRDNYAHLVKIKTKYDPANLFHVNQNIRPNG